MNKPRIADDGTHVIPVTNLNYTGRESYAEATGELRWHPEKGVTLTVQFPNASRTALEQYFGRHETRAGNGSFNARSSTPNWTGQTTDGMLLTIFSLNETPISTTETGTRGNRVYSRVEVEVFVACVEFHKNSPLAFWHQTPPNSRMLCLGFGCHAWQRTEEVTYQHDNGETTIGRGSTKLSSIPCVNLVSAGQFNMPHDVKACWLVSEESSDGLNYPHNDARSFVSFLNGRRTPFFWHDSFIEDEKLCRTYYGWERSPLYQLHTSYTQPLPLYGTVDALNFAKEVVAKLPTLFTAFLHQDEQMRLTFILNPIWVGTNGILDDKFTLACVSLERLSTAWSQNPVKKSSPKLFPKQTASKIQDSLNEIIDGLETQISLSEAQKTILQKRVANICAPPNSDKLSGVFRDLGVELSPENMIALNTRNNAMHGRATLENATDLVVLNSEAERCYTLQMLITKAILRLLNYQGPFVNYTVQNGSMVEYM